MAIRGNRYSDPALGQAFEGIASLFSPVSAQELAGYAQADAMRGKALRTAKDMELIDLYVNGGDERMGIGAGLFTPNQSESMTRRSQDLDLEGKKYTSDNTLRGVQYTSDNSLKGSLAGDLLKPVGEGEIRPELSAEMAAYFGLPGAVASVQGRDKPLTSDQVHALTLQEIRAKNPEAAEWSALGGKNPVEAVDAEGRSVLAAPHAAAGMGVYEAPESRKPTNYRTPDGAEGIAIQNADGSLVDAQSGVPVPAGSTMFSTTATGTREDVGLGASPTGKIQLSLRDNLATQNIGARLSSLIAQNPASQGLVGWMRGTAQDLIQAGGEVGAFFGGETQRIMQQVQNDAIERELIAPGGAFDPSLPAIDMLMNMFAYNYAKTTTGERLSNEMVRQWRESLGLGNPFGNQANTMARLNEAMTQLKDREAADLQMLKTGQFGPAAAVPTPPTPPAPPTPPSIPPRAVEALRANPTPELRRQFDEKFGAGSAASILGN